MFLYMLKKGELAEIDRVIGSATWKKRLEDMGFVPGTLIQVVLAQSGNLIVEVRGTRFAINRDMAKHVRIRPRK
ncbi:ferrous iron transport protein A [Atopobacter sp. AH10]|uniref:FeoA family protein n=1 Tax=Atopobacter sp. AH10 TaxID=2315861 RepID=UPI000EF22E0C|nr:FeoA family protein [Atopobacter sp. AH10]RLK63423.1 ferrous iron transport protein A [Atopobacter sp. AH10]